MKALSLKQPYASWIAEGRKTIETRTWRTNYRGEFLVVASLGTDLLRDMGYRVNGNSAVLDKVTGSEWYSFPRGVALATANLVDCRPMVEQDETAACCERYDGAWAWLLTDVMKIEPFPVKGQLSFFEVPYGEHQSKLPEVA
jgi:hypothetical protein